MAVEALEYIKSKTKIIPEIGLILGSGLGDFADSLEEKIKIPYKDIPYFS